MRSRLIAALALAATVLTGTVGCSSSSSSPSSPTSTAAKPSGAQSGGGTAAGNNAASALADRVGTALNALTSVHLDIDAGGLGGKSTADIMLQNGHATATDAHLTENGMQVEMITVGGHSYAKLPAGSNPSGKPWLEIGSDSTNPMINSLTSGLNIAAMASSLEVVTALMRGSTGLQDKGADSVDGVSATHYVMLLDPAKKTGNAQLDGLLSSLGGSAIPLEFWLDSSDRPVKFVIHASFAGTSFPVTVQAGKFDAPLSITAPPASQVSGK
ncbi:MAG TPA: hypothetical protein VFT67_06575 [Jatrophihabitantaceae bacterium]|nr:hypothetical protein [Jatrophihabitantaceae bacterium]